MRRAALLAVLATVLAGCGGSQQPPATATPPRLPHALALTWAAQATVVAHALAGGDCRTARDQANRLRDAVDRAVAQHEVSARLASMLAPTVDALPDRIGECNAVPPPQPAEHDHGNGHHGKDKGNKDGEG